MPYVIVDCNDTEGTVTYEIDYGGKGVLREQLRVEDYPTKEDIIARIEEREAHAMEGHKDQKARPAIPSEIKAMVAQALDQAAKIG